MPQRNILIIVGCIAIVLAAWEFPMPYRPSRWLLLDLDSSDTARATRALEEIKRRRDPGIVNSLAERLEKAPANAREIAAALGAAGAPAVDPLARVLESGPFRVRPVAVYGLGETRHARALPPLVAALDTGDDDVRKAAIIALAYIPDPRADAALIEIMRSTNRDLAYWASYSLSLQKSVAALPMIRDLCHELTDAMRRRECYYSIARIGGPDAVGMLIEGMTVDGSKFVRMEIAAMLPLDDPRVPPALDAAPLAGHHEVIAGAHQYYLSLSPPFDEDRLIDAFVRYGGPAMAEEMIASGRPRLVAVAEGEKTNPRPRLVEVK